MKLIVKDSVILFDREDADIVASKKWHINDNGYAVWRGVEQGVKRTVRLHRLILERKVGRIPKGYVCDHINHNRLDNRRANLRLTTQSGNMRNLTNQGRGYWYQKQNHNWVVEIYGKHIGCFATEEEADKVARLVRSGGTYKKPERTECRKGHVLSEVGYYQYADGVKICKACSKERMHKYYESKKRRTRGSGSN